MTDIEKVRSEIELTRAELARTVDALHAKLDVKTIAKERVDEAGARAAEAYQHAKASAPEPVQHAIGRVEQAAAPLVSKAAQDKKRTAMIAGGAVFALLLLRRLRRAGSDNA
ncbi:MAG TPA: DUF3618 domain-containing protein [Jatrophihabitantaceae bacterium]|nr:DUF3618 domain-containing protein [Jatrophihabitantaceae bacterium]